MRTLDEVEGRGVSGGGGIGAGDGSIVPAAPDPVVPICFAPQAS